MKIQAITVITKLELGGAQQLALYTAEHLDRGRFQPHLIAGQGGILDLEARDLNDVPVYFAPDLIREIRPQRDVLALQQIRRRIRHIRRSHGDGIVLVHTHSSKAGILGRWAAWLEGVPIIMHTYHGFGFNTEQKPWIQWVYQTVERVTGKVSHGFIMVSEDNLKTARRLGIASCHLDRVIHGGIRVSEFQGVAESKASVRKALGLDADERVVTMISCLKPQKAPLDFVRMAHLVSSQEPQTRFLLVGDGELRPEVEASVRQLGLQERFNLLGWRRDIPRILHASDVMVLTSRWEGFPLVFPQAMAAGLPAVATRVDGSPEAVREGENGFLIEPGDMNGMAERVLRLLRDEGLRRAMGDAGRKRVYAFDIDEMVARQEALYEEMASRIVGESRRRA